ncbi:hypothetical protein PG995_012048 [Apiospora arundinis]
MAFEKKSQQASVEELERRFAKLNVKVEQTNGQVQKAFSKEEQRGTSIFRKPAREITEDNFLDELDRLEQQWFANKCKKSAQKAAETKKILSEVEEFMKNLK